MIFEALIIILLLFFIKRKIMTGHLLGCMQYSLIKQELLCLFPGRMDAASCCLNFFSFNYHHLHRHKRQTVVADQTNVRVE